MFQGTLQERFGNVSFVILIPIIILPKLSILNRVGNDRWIKSNIVTTRIYLPYGCGLKNSTQARRNIEARSNMS
jgi:hypothetical protein